MNLAGQLALLLIGARALGWLARRAGQPPIVGELAAGLLMGPTLFGRLAPETFGAVFPPVSAHAALPAVLELCVSFVMLAAGLGFDAAEVKRQSRSTVFAAVLGLVIPFATGAALGAALGFGFQGSAVLGLAMAVSAVPVSTRILQDLGLLKTRIGQVILAAGLFDDLVIFISLSILGGIAHGGAPTPAGIARLVASVVLLYGVALTAGPRIAEWLLRAGNKAFPSDRWVLATLAILLTLACGALAHAIGIPSLFGAFLAGAMLTQAPSFPDDARDVLSGLVMSVAAPIFFSSIFMKADLWRSFDPLLTLAVLAVAIGGKFAGGALGAKLGGMDWVDSVAIGCGMNARGVVELIVASLAFELGFVTEPVFAALVLMAIVTTMMTPPLLRRALGRRAAAVLKPHSQPDEVLL